MQTFYIITRRNKIQKLDSANRLVPIQPRESGVLFDDYNQARNAVRRSAAIYDRKFRGEVVKEYKIVRMAL